MKITRLFAASTVAVLLATSSMAQEEPNASTVVATVNGTDITVGHVIALTNRLPPRFQQIPDADLFKGVVDQLIQQTALAGGVATDSKAMQLAIENETRALLASEAIREIEDQAVTEDLVEQAYEKQYADFEGAEEYNASHILVETEEEAKELVAALEGGADFAELAKEKSTGPSGPNGGSLGWTGKGSFVPEFEAAMIALEKGGVSAPVKTQFGWHVITLVDKRQQPKPALVEVRAELIEQLKQVAVNNRMEQIDLTADIQRTETEIDPSIIRNLDLLAD